MRALTVFSVSRGTSPERTSTSPSNPPRAFSVCRTAWPVPSCCACSMKSTRGFTFEMCAISDSFCHPTMISVRSACSFAASSVTYSTIGLPCIGYITLAMSGLFMRVPLPAARMMTASLVGLESSITLQFSRNAHERVIDQADVTDPDSKRHEGGRSGGQGAQLAERFRVGEGDVVDRCGGLGPDQLHHLGRNG